MLLICCKLPHAAASTCFFFRACTHDRTVSVLAVFEYIEQTYALHDNSDVGTESRVLHLGHLMTIEFFVQGTDSRVK